MTITHMINKGYRVSYRIKNSSETGISYGPVLRDIKSMIDFRNPNPDLIEYVVEHGVDGDWAPIRNVGCSGIDSDVPSLTEQC